MVRKKDRQRVLARQKWERQQARRVERRRKAKRRAVVGGAVFGVLAVLAGTAGIWWLGRDDPSAASPPTSSPTPSATPSATPSGTPTASPDPESTDVAAPRPSKAGQCTYVRQPGADQLSIGRPKAGYTPAEAASATITTNRGTITAELFAGKAGCAVHSMEFLAGKNAFDQTSCTVLAVAPASARYLGCGGLSDSGQRGPGYIFGNENDRTKVGPGRLVLAGPENRNGSKFFITYGEAASFDRPVTVLGRVTSGLPVVEKVAKGGVVASGNGSKGDSSTSGVGRPKKNLIVQDVKVTTT